MLPARCLGADFTRRQHGQCDRKFRGASLAISRPGGLAFGDLLIAQVTVNGTATASPPPAGP